jgi:bifunctional non-homologous end joining protein LigD
LASVIFVYDHPSYLGLREDKKPQAVALEVEAPVAEVTSPAPSKVKITNRDRVIDPDGGATKGQLADHYAAVAPIMLPWVGSRPSASFAVPRVEPKNASSRSTTPARSVTTPIMSRS